MYPVLAVDAPHDMDWNSPLLLISWWNLSKARMIGITFLAMMDVYTATCGQEIDVVLFWRFIPAPYELIKNNHTPYRIYKHAWWLMYMKCNVCTNVIHLQTHQGLDWHLYVPHTANRLASRRLIRAHAGGCKRKSRNLDGIPRVHWSLVSVALRIAFLYDGPTDRCSRATQEPVQSEHHVMLVTRDSLILLSRNIYGTHGSHSIYPSIGAITKSKLS